MSSRRKESFSGPPEAGDADLDITLYRSDSLSSLSSGDSDGGPQEPTAAEISLLSASIDARNVEAARDLEAEALAAEAAMSAASNVETSDSEEVTPVFPAGFHRLPSAMRPPIRRGHVRSASAGGAAVLNFHRGLQRNNSSAVAENATTSTSVASSASSNTTKLPPSVLKASGTSTVAARSAAGQKHHRRVFSHGHITFGGKEEGKAEEMPPRSGGGGHKRTASKTDFILPPDHEERERKRHSLQRQDSARSHRRHDSLAFSFRGHSRQASRTDSIYTLRASSGYNSTSCKDRLCFPFWNRCKGNKNSSTDAATAAGQFFAASIYADRLRNIVPNHTIPSDVPQDKHPNHHYSNNEIRTTKYTWLTFLPKNLFEQFHRFANLYFLFIVILNWVPSISAFGREISMLPVIFVLGVTAIKDIFEDRRRYLSDKRVNNSTCRVYKSGRYVKTLWKDVKVGDMVHLSCNEMIPADILVLRSSDEHGLCYIDTQNLDGEANLKQREVPRGFVDMQRGFQPQDFRSTVECDLPTTKIYRFNGSISHPNGEKVPVGKDNLLLRECLLKNTTFVEGLVVYAGKDSKAMLNNGGPRYKRSKLEVQMNKDVIWCVLILVILCLIGAIGTSTWLSSFTEHVPFLNTLTFEETRPGFDGFLVFWTFVIMLQVIIPVSLYVTIEMTKLLQIYLIHQDIKMYDESCDQRVECRALNIPEELGQIQYVFCDKTGTLTENIMVFKRCTIGGQDFAHNSITTKNSMASLHHFPTATPTTGRAIIPVNPTLSDRLSSMDIQLLIEGKETKMKMHPQAGLTQDFFLLLALCNTVIVAKHPHKDVMNASGMICNASMASAAEIVENGQDIETHSTVTSTTSIHSAPLNPDPSLTPKRPNRFNFNNPLSPIASSPENSPPSSPQVHRPKHLQLPSILSKFMSGRESKLNNHSRSPTPTPCELRPIYEAESPDELALVDAAFAYNCKLLKRSPHHAVVSLPGEGLIEFQVLHVLPFDSNRKRMSIILKHPVTHERILFCKGADSAIFPRVATKTPEDESVLEKTQTHLNIYAKQGLRVLVMAKRILAEEDYQKWLVLHHEAETSLHAREKLLMESYKRIEDNLSLIGATGIEDKLQEGVPNTIANLRLAGIVVWVLTGDKQETAINIAYSCKLFAQDMQIILLNARSRDSAESIIKTNLEKASKQPELRSNRALVVDGKTLVYILDKRAKLQQSFLQLTSLCSAVLGCRATPLQKAYIVKIVKEELGMHTLAIGDGANDVSMIQTADVGVGISGMEGRQAVMASDFAISKFKYLERLLLVHGHWNYDRLSRMVLYFFYKNAAFVFVTFWFQIFNGFSGSIMFDHMYLMLYNLLWTSLPPMAIGVLDQDAPDIVLESKPRLYVRGRESHVYKPYSFWLNMVDSLYQSLVIFFVSYGAYFNSDVGLWEFGTAIITSCLCTMLIHQAVETKSWTIIHWTSMMLSILFYFAFALIYNSFCITCFGLQNPFWVMQHTMGTGEFWLVCLLSAVLAILPRVSVKVFKNTFKPDAVTSEILHRSHQKVGKGSGSSRMSTQSTNLSWSRGTSQTSSRRRSQQQQDKNLTEMTAIIP